MKKYIVTLLSIMLIVLMVTSCGASDSSQSEPQTDEEAVEEQVPETLYTENQTEMANFINFHTACIDNGWIYSKGIDRNDYDAMCFVKRRLDNSDVTILQKDKDPSFIYVNGEYIYAVLTNFDNGNSSENGSSSIYRYRLGGDDETELVTNASTLQIEDDSIYYSKCEAGGICLQYCKADIDGNNEQVVLDKEIYYPYYFDNSVFYQDQEDNETIHQYNIETKEDKKLTQEKTYGFFIDDESLFCLLDEDNDGSASLVKIDINTLESNLLYDGAATNGINVKDDTIFFSNGNDEERLYSINKDGSNISIITQDNYCRTPIIFDDRMIYIKCTPDYVYDDIVICKLDGSDKQSL